MNEALVALVDEFSAFYAPIVAREPGRRPSDTPTNASDARP